MNARVVLDPPLSPMQLVCVELTALGKPAREVAEILGVAPETVRFHVKLAAQKIPGDLPHRLRVIAWARGATLDVLTGRALRLDVLNGAYRATLLPNLPELVG